ncbi:MAG: helix-turn-helix transcriptional regulator, partial [Deltaproteobacteria bacterium]
LHLAAGGFTNPQIAKHLSISVRTVESYRASFMRKLGLRHQTDVVRYALRSGTLRIAIPAQ